MKPAACDGRFALALSELRSAAHQMNDVQEIHMTFRRSITLVGAVVSATLLASSGYAGDKPSATSSTAYQDCSTMTGANRTDCEKRAQERTSSVHKDADHAASGHSASGSRSTESAPASSAAASSSDSTTSSSDRTRLSQRDDDVGTSSDSDEERGQNKSPAPSSNGTTMDWNQTDPSRTSGTTSGEAQRSPGRSDAASKTDADMRPSSSDDAVDGTE